MKFMVANKVCLRCAFGPECGDSICNYTQGVVLTVLHKGSHTLAKQSSSDIVSIGPYGPEISEMEQANNLIYGGGDEKSEAQGTVQ